MNRLRILRQGVVKTVILSLCVAGFVHSYADEASKKSQDKDVAAEKTSETKSDEKKSADSVAKSKKAKSSAKVVALFGGRINTMAAEGVIENGTVIITDDVITAVGKDLEIPDGTTCIDATGMTVSPGLIDSRSSLWLASDSVSASASDASLKAIDAVDPFSDSWIEVSRQGITAVSVQPSGSLGGESVVLRVAPADSVAGLVIKETAAVQASIGLSGATGNSRDRYLQYEALKKKLDAAKTYKEEWDKYEAAIKKASEKPTDPKKPTEEKKAGSSAQSGRSSQRPTTGARTGFGGGARGGSRGPGGGREERGQSPSEAAKPAESEKKPTTPAKATDAEAKKAEPPKKPKQDPLKDLLVKVLKKEVPLRLEAHRADDVANALKLAEDFDLTIVLEGLTQAGRSWSTLQEQHPPMVAGPFAMFESQPSYASSDADRFERLCDVDGLLAIASFSKDSRGSRLLRMHASAAVAAGLTPDKALRAITIDAAKVLGIDAKTGSLEVGKHADIVVVAGDPLNPAAAVMMTMSQGEIVYQAKDVTKPLPHDHLVTVPELNSQLPKNFALVSDRVLFANGTMAPGAIWVKSGMITGVATTKTETGDLRVIDMGAAVITPGLIAAHVSEVDVESTDAVASHVRAIDSFSPDSKVLQKLSEGGFTSVMYSPDSRSVVCGQIGCVRFHAKQQVMLDKSGPVLPASKFVLASPARSSSRYPASLSGQLVLLNKYFNGDVVSSNLYIPAAVRELMTVQHDELLASLKGKSKVAVLEAGSSPEVDAALSLIRSHGLKALILHPEDIDTSIDAISKLNAGLIVRAARISDHDWYARDIADASNKGVKVAVSGDDPIKMRETLATLVNAGMSAESALRSLTSDPADSFAVTKVGQLATGSVADIVIWDGSPINPAARPIHVIVDGRLTKDAQ